MNDTPQPSPSKAFFQDVTRLNLALGFVTGVAVLASVGFFVLLTKAGGDGTPTKRVAAVTNDATNPSPSVAAANDQPTGPVKLPDVTKDDHVLGQVGAKVTVMEFADLQCPFCQKFHPSIKQLAQEYGDTIAIVYKHFPLDSIHPQARPAALASECLAEQDKFWEFIDKSFENQELLGPDFYLSTAKSLGVKESKFKTCLDTQKYAGRVDQDAQQGEQAGVNGTPTTFVNGIAVSGAQPYATLKAAVDRALASS